MERSKSEKNSDTSAQQRVQSKTTGFMARGRLRSASRKRVWPLDELMDMAVCQPAGAVDHAANLLLLHHEAVHGASHTHKIPSTGSMPRSASSTGITSTSTIVTAPLPVKQRAWEDVTHRTVLEGTAEYRGQVRPSSAVKYCI